MVSHLAAFSIFALPIFAVATPTNVNRNDTPTSACCASTEPANSAAGTSILNLLGISLGDIDVLLALSCTSITVGGADSGPACSSGTPVSCTDGFVHGIGIGCVPVTL